MSFETDDQSGTGEAIDPGNWQKVKSLLGAALERPSGERAAYLEEACQGDSELRRAVESLLVADPGAVTFLERSPSRLLDEAESARLEGRRIGPYKVLREIGRGGMGVVYLASRADDILEREVALKVLSTAGAEEDLEREIRILAGLNHPNIGRLYDWGRTDDGLLYFIMEHIEGQPITSYCEEQGFGLRDKIELFLRVCEAVEHAHRRFVVHLDLKPSNILVTAGGEPKLLDFGIAGLLSEEPDGRTAEARADRRMTRDYASPEQRAGEPVTMASDVFSLGVLLYELLTGWNPFHLTSRDEPLLPPSEAASREGASADRRPETGRRRLCRRLEGDLDAIVLQAMHPDPEKRYPSIEQLYQDLQSYLLGRPVAARGNSIVYVTRKLLVRRWPWVVTAAGFLLMITLFGFFQWRQSRQLAGALATAGREREKFERTSEFLIGLFEISDPSEARGASITAREILDRGGAQIRSELRDQPEVRASLAGTMGMVYRNLGLYGRAAPLLEEALALRRSQREESLEVAESLGELAILLRQRGEYDRAEALARESLLLYRRLLGPDHLQVANAANDLGVALLEIRQDPKAAEPLVTEALAIRRRHLSPGHPDIANSLMTLAAIQQQKGDADAAQALYGKAVAIYRRLYPGDHPLKGDALHNLGVAQMAGGKYDKAETSLRDALAIRKRVLGPEHQKAIHTMNELALTLTEQGNYAAAEPLMQEVLQLRKRVLGERHPDVAISLMSLSYMWQDQGRYAEAEAVSRQALTLWQNLLGEEHPTVATAIENVAVLLLLQGRYDEAEPLYLRVLNLRRKLLGERHPDVAATLTGLATLYGKRGQYKMAESYSRQAIALYRETRGNDHPELAGGLVGLSGDLANQKRYEEGEAAAREAVKILHKAYPRGHWTLDVAESSVARCLVGQKRFKEAEPIILRSYEHAVATMGAESPGVRKIAAVAVLLYKAWGRPKETARFAAVVSGGGS